MPPINRQTLFTVALSLFFSLFCLPLARTTFASRNLHCAQHRGDPRGAYKEGISALDGADYEKAAEYFKEAAAGKPDDMRAFYYFGLCLLKLKRFDEAAKAYQQAMAIKPMEAAVHYQLGKTYLEMGDREAAEKEHRWLQERDQELALYFSDLLLSDQQDTKQIQEALVSSTNDKSAYEPMTANLRPTILHYEKAKYTEIARTNRLQGTVVLQVVFAVNGEIQNIRALHPLPDGLTRKAIEVARKIKFKSATKDGEPVSVRGKLEFVFNLY
jgi:TonB family protein